MTKIDPTFQKGIEDELHLSCGLISNFWTPKSLEEGCDLVLATDGMAGDHPHIQSNVYAQLVVNFASSDDWSWGLGEILGSIDRSDNRIEQNGLGWIKEVFGILENYFDEMAPAYDTENPESTALFQEFYRYIATAVNYRLKLKPHHTVEQWQTSPYDELLTRGTIALMEQLVTGTNPMFHEVEKSKPAAKDIHVQFNERDVNLEVVVTADDQKFTAAIVFGSNLEAKAAKINHDAQMALLWKLCENIDREIAIEVIDRLPLEFSKGMEKRKDDYDLSSSQLSDLIIHCANGIYSQPIRERL